MTNLVQLGMIKDYTNKLKAAVGEEETAQIIAKSVFILCMGSNYISVKYYLTPFGRPQYDVNEYTSMLGFQQKLYELGARRIGVMNVSPQGWVPLQRTVLGGIGRQRIESENQAAWFFNSKLSSSMRNLNTRLPDAKLVYLDTNSTRRYGSTP